MPLTGGMVWRHGQPKKNEHYARQVAQKSLKSGSQNKMKKLPTYDCLRLRLLSHGSTAYLDHCIMQRMQCISRFFFAELVYLEPADSCSALSMCVWLIMISLTGRCCCCQGCLTEYMTDEVCSPMALYVVALPVGSCFMGSPMLRIVKKTPLRCHVMRLAGARIGALQHTAYGLSRLC
jgi:hypothetical protein